MTEEEYRNWKLFHEDNPLDDQSNFHVPPAQLAKLYASAHLAKGAVPPKIADFLLFRKAEDESDIDALLLGGGW